MKVLVDKDILIGCYEILKKYYIVQGFTSVYKISRKEKMIYSAIAKIVEGKKNV